METVLITLGTLAGVAIIGWIIWRVGMAYAKGFQR